MSSRTSIKPEALQGGVEFEPVAAVPLVLFGCSAFRAIENGDGIEKVGVVEGID